MKTSQRTFDDSSLQSNTEKYFFSQAQTTFSATALKKQTESSTTLDEDLHYDIGMLTHLFSKPKWAIAPLSKRRKAGAPVQKGLDGGMCLVLVLPLCDCLSLAL